jgi:hypothetical protein
MRRNRPRSARPRLTRFVGSDCFRVRLSLTAIALPSRDDSSFDPAAAGSIGVDHGQRNALRLAQGHHASLTVVRRVSVRSTVMPSKICVAKSKSKPRSRRFRWPFRASQPKRTRIAYACIYVLASRGTVWLSGEPAVGELVQSRVSCRPATRTARGGALPRPARCRRDGCHACRLRRKASCGTSCGTGAWPFRRTGG